MSQVDESDRMNIQIKQSQYCVNFVILSIGTKQKSVNKYIDFVGE
jgi:hypothetical protein